MRLPIFLTLVAMLGLPVTGLAQRGAAPADEVPLSQVRAEINAAKNALQTATNATERFRYKRLQADLELELASRAVEPRAPARRALTLYYDLLKIRTQPHIESDLLYRSAYAAELSGEVSSGIVSLTRLITSYPRDPIIPEAYFRRAEMRFTYGNYKESEEDYSYVLRRGASDFQLQSLYKRGWARYKQSDYSRALVDQLTVLNSLLEPGNINPDGSLNVQGLSGAKQELARDALRNMTLNFAKLGNRLPPASFTRQTQSERFEYLFTRSLIDYYQEQGENAKAAQMATAFAQSQPNHPQAGALESQAIASYDADGQDSRALRAKIEFVRRYGLQGAQWQGRPALEVAEVRTTLAEYLDYITQTLHARAQSSKQTSDYAEAAEWYQNYLQVFPGSPRVAELTYLRGDVLFEAGRFEPAAAAYQQVAYNLPQSPRSADAGYAAVYATRQANPDSAAGQNQVKAATLRFAETYPQHPQVGSTLARLAEDLYESGRRDEAAAIADKLIAHRPAASLAQLKNAYRIRAAAAQDADNYVAAEEAYRWLLEQASASEALAVREALASTLYKRGEALVQAGDDAAAITQFLKIRDVVPPTGEPASEIRSVALYDAAAASIRAGNKAEGAALLEDYRATYPNDPQAARVDTRLAALYLELGEDDKALREFNRISDATTSDAATRTEARLETAELYAKNGNYAAAIQTYKDFYYKNEPPLERGMEVQQRLVELYTTTGEREKADFWRERLIESHPNVNSERSRTLAARAQLALADNAGEAFAAAALFPPLTSSLKVKKARLQSALDAYGRAADYGIIDVTTAATYRLGELYYAFSRALIESPRPDDLDAEEGARYEVLLEEQAFPFEEEAINLHQVNADRQAEGVKNQWVEKSLERLSVLLPARYAKTERLGDGIVLLEQ